MNIPNSKSIMLPFLQYIDDSQEYHRKNIAEALAAKPFKLTPEQKAELMPSGTPVFDYRCDWTKTHLKKAGLVEIPKHGYSRITDHGLAFLEAWNNDPEEIEDAIMKSPAKFYDYVNNRWPTEGKNDNDQISEESIEDEDDDQTLAGMDFIKEIRNLSTKIERHKDIIQNEEMTKTAFVMPFINLLGYDVSDPTEVVPEFTADFGARQGEKVDYAIFKDDEVIMIVECKKFGTDLSDTHTAQLYRYFSVTHARIAVLTDGALYRFYTDLERSNIMDTKPFLEFNLLDIQDPLANELERFTKPDFNLDTIRIAAGDLKYTKKIKQTLVAQLEAPTEEFVQFFLSSVYSGERTPAKIQQFTGIVKRALNQFLDEQMNQRSQSVMSEEEAAEGSVEVEESDEWTADKVESDDEHQTGKSKPKGLVVTFPDGTVFSSEWDSKDQTEVWVEAIRKLLEQFGVKRIMEVDLKMRRPGSKERIISTDATFRNANRRKVPSTGYQEKGITYFITHDHKAEVKKRLLDSISGVLGAGLKVEVL